MKNIKDDIAQEGFFIAEHFFTDKFIDEIIEQLDRYNALQYGKKKIYDFNR